MFAKYIIRLDDASPTMHKTNWDRVENLLDRYNVTPIVAVIPNNKDETLMIDTPDPHFWEKVKVWQSKNWEIALHGYEHQYSTKVPSIVPINNYSEFAGVPLERQEQKLKEGLAIFKKHQITTRLWVAPAHSFDENTIQALKSQTNINIISDGIALAPYWSHQMYWVPQQLWKFRKMFLGTWTGCFHPNTMQEEEFIRLEQFLEAHHSQFTSIEKLSLKKRKKSMLEKLLEFLYWKMLKRKREKSHQREKEEL